ncbi:MAG: hypothetical protein JWM80_5453, partial [Cyanobacteria bacterium RYN_339]|nr:hypothetical protein [Cyanobacteria bacterium RYN_339]
NEYIHGVADANLVDGAVEEDPDAMNDLGKPQSHGCWNMSNPNVVELVERFGIGATFDESGKEHLSHTHVRILGNSKQDRAESQHLEDLMVKEKLGDRMPSDGIDLLEKDFKTTKRYVRDHSYYDVQGNVQPADKWYVDLWQARKKLEEL